MQNTMEDIANPCPLPSQEWSRVVWTLYNWLHSMIYVLWLLSTGPN